MMSRNIAITQRLFEIPEYKEVREALDVNWHPFLAACGWNSAPVSCNHEVEVFCRECNISAVVFSGGNDLYPVSGKAIDKRRDEFESRLLEYAIAQGLPVIGVCRGMQFINTYFGGTLKRVEGHVATRHAITGEGDGLPAEVNSYHNYAVDVPGKGLVVTARAAAGGIEAVRHESLNIRAIMWHPEREAEFVSEDIKLFSSL